MGVEGRLPAPLPTGLPLSRFHRFPGRGTLGLWSSSFAWRKAGFKLIISSRDSGYALRLEPTSLA
jgi:hypothetical protein